MQIAIGMLISMGLLYAVFINVPWESVIQAIALLDVKMLALSSLFFTMGCLFRAIAWKITNKVQQSSPSFSYLFGGVMVGYLANNILPLKSGELVRAHYLSRTGSISFFHATGTIVVERFFDVITLFGLLLCLLSLSMEQAVSADLYSLVLLIGGGIVGFIGILYISRNNVALRNALQRVSWISRILELLGCLFDKKIAALVFVAILGSWVCNYLSVWVLLDVVETERVKAALFLLVLVNFSMLIPASPGAFGVIQMAFLVALQPFGVEAEQAVALSFGYQAGFYVASVLFGIPYYFYSGLKFSAFAKADENIKA